MKKRFLSIILMLAVLVTFSPSVNYAASKKITLKASSLSNITIRLSWTKVSKAKKYVIYGAKYGSTIRKIATIKSTKTRRYTIKKINKKYLAQNTKYKFYVSAYSSKKRLAKSKAIIVRTKKKPAPTPTPTPVDDSYLRVGGNIFFVDKTVNNGLIYKFYDSNVKEITASSWSVDASGYPSGLEKAKYYTVEGSRTNSKDKFYVYAIKDGKTKYGGIYTYLDDSKHTFDGVEWGARGTAVGALNSGIGQGKVNTAIALSVKASFIAYTTQDNTETMWTWLQRMNNDKFNSCNDWYIGAIEEHNKLINSKAAGKEIYEAYKIWSSQEAEGYPNMARCWYNTTHAWRDNYKSTAWGMDTISNSIAFRSF